MKAKELAKKLLEHPDMDVLVAELDNESRVWGVSRVEFKIADEDEYPASYNLREGFEFILLY